MKGNQFDRHLRNENLLNLSSIMLSLIKIKDIHQCEDANYVCAIVITSPRATHVVRGGDLVPAGTMLVTPVLESD